MLWAYKKFFYEFYFLPCPKPSYFPLPIRTLIHNDLNKYLHHYSVEGLEKVKNQRKRSIYRTIFRKD